MVYISTSGSACTHVFPHEQAYFVSHCQEPSPSFLASLSPSTGEGYSHRTRKCTLHTWENRCSERHNLPCARQILCSRQVCLTFPSNLKSTLSSSLYDTGHPCKAGAAVARDNFRPRVASNGNVETSECCAEWWKQSLFSIGCGVNSTYCHVDCTLFGTRHGRVSRRGRSNPSADVTHPFCYQELRLPALQTDSSEEP